MSSTTSITTGAAVRGGMALDAFDARTVEFQCALRKLHQLTTHIRALRIRLKAAPGSVPLVHYAATLCAGVISVNEHLRRRLVMTSQLKPVKDMRKVVPQVNTSPLSFEAEDEERDVVQYTGDVNYALLFDQLLALCDNASAIYSAKLSRCLEERDANRRPDAIHKPIPLDMAEFTDLLEPLEVLALGKFTVPLDELDSYQFKAVPIFLDAVQATVNNIGTYLAKLTIYKQKPTDTELKRLPHWEHTIHRIVASTVKLSELYSILRRFGRELYLPASNELHAPKILHKNPAWESILSQMDDYLKAPKKNEQLLFTLARVTRQEAMFQVKHATIAELVTSLQQSHALIVKFIALLREFAKCWEQLRSYRSNLKLDTSIPTRDPIRMVSPTSKTIAVLFDPTREKLVQENLAKQQRHRERCALEGRSQKELLEKQKQLKEEELSRRRFEEREKQLRADLTRDRHSPAPSRAGSLTRPARANSSGTQELTSIGGRARAGSNSSPTLGNRSRSTSNASVSSNSSSSSQLNSLKKSPTASVSPTATHSPSLQHRRPQSMYMSSPAFDIRSQLRRQERLKQESLLLASDSQPLKRSASLQQSPAQRKTMIQAAATSALTYATSPSGKDVRHSSLKMQSELRKQQAKVVVDPSPRSFSPIPRALPNISELKVGTPTKEYTYTQSPPLSPELVPSRLHSQDPTSPITLTPSHTGDEFDITPTKSKSHSASVILDTPIKEDIITTVSSLHDTKPRSMCDVVLPVKLTDDSKTETSTKPELTDTASSGCSEEEQAKRTIKKVRFTGVPAYVEDPKPTRQGWTKPPKNWQKKTGFQLDNLQVDKLSLSAFRKGGINVTTSMPDRIMSTLTLGPQKKGWRLGRR